MKYKAQMNTDAFPFLSRKLWRSSAFLSGAISNSQSTNQWTIMKTVNNVGDFRVGVFPTATASPRLSYEFGRVAVVSVRFTLKDLARIVYWWCKEFITVYPVTQASRLTFRVKGIIWSEEMEKTYGGNASQKDLEHKHMSTVLVLLDYWKAFDSINNELMVAKLYYYGFN